ncbi:methyl CoM reductase subunit alpha [Methanopyrus kandleri]|uniref:coenzyme-B sulfoethylthiotransferase n=2 Tax=Methanopyrus kandleri TaxID=2320 RepID=Q8TVA5_METKA|nr:methyl CoM reductase subunit alpha [Methanopyrus kandleri]AAM02700.1 Methyl coenzyme M reductase, alpha subunit, fragment [Methanopyrus kandleri AV19]HII70957.1 hypothetical protein [Methanopyrus kandleri]
MVERSKEEALFIKALKEKFEEDPEEKHTKFYVYGGYRQSPRKEFAKGALREFEPAGERDLIVPAE